MEQANFDFIDELDQFGRKYLTIIYRSPVPDNGMPGTYFVTYASKTVGWLIKWLRF